MTHKISHTVTQSLTVGMPLRYENSLISENQILLLGCKTIHPAHQLALIFNHYLKNHESVSLPPPSPPCKSGTKIIMQNYIS